LAFNPQEGDVVLTFDNALNLLQRHTFQNGAWDQMPALRWGEACFVRTVRPRVIRYTGLRPL
ncbi:MAG: hypothetical protein DME25_01450, partial [Verrucomicrobia bacterium]